MKSAAVIGYSGHAYVAIDAIQAMKKEVTAYFEFEDKDLNPYGLNYQGADSKDKLIELSNQFEYFIGIGDNLIRRNIYELHSSIDFINAIHPSAQIGSKVQLGKGVLVAPNATINALTKVGNGVICNSGSIIEHECIIGDFAHIAPGAVLCGNVEIGDNTFIGANTVVKQGIRIGKNVVVGAGSVVIRDIEDNQTVAGNPARKI